MSIVHRSPGTCPESPRGPRADSGHPAPTGPRTAPTDPGAYVVTFGKHKNKTLSQIPEDYVRWLHENGSASVKAAAAKYLDIDQPETFEEPDPTPAAVALPLIVFEWQQDQRQRFAGDPAALNVVEAGLAKLKSLCSRYTKKGWPNDRDIIAAATAPAAGVRP